MHRKTGPIQVALWSMAWLHACTPCDFACFASQTTVLSGDEGGNSRGERRPEPQSDKRKSNEQPPPAPGRDSR